jgi:hypothetical protein
VLGRDYLVFIVNMCDWVVRGVRVNNQYDAYLPSPFGRTCSSDYDTCVANGGYQPVINTPCRDSSYMLQLIVKWPTQNQEFYTTSVRIDPDCTKIGVAIGMNIPAPG